MKRLFLILLMASAIWNETSAQKVTTELKSDTIEVMQVFYVDSATKFIKAQEMPFLVRKAEVNKVEGLSKEVPGWLRIIGFYDPKNKLISPVMIQGKDGRLTLF